jgi:hypothetical protein
MHYKTPRINLNIQPVERFFEALQGWPIEQPGSADLTIRRETLPESRRIISLDPSR